MNVKAMPSSSRPRGSGTNSGRPIMSERQQISLLMQMTTSTNQSELSPGGNNNNPARSRDRNERGETALHVAAIKGDQDGVKKLLEQGMSPNVTDFAEWTPLHEACNHGHYNVALTLVKSGANVNAKGLDDDTPLHDAAIVGQLKLVKMLVEKGADPCFKNRKGKTPCDVAAPAVYNFLLTAKDNAANRNSQQQLKKPPDAKKATVEETDDGGATSSGGASSGTNTSSSVSKEEDDIYEFKSTPKDINSGDDKSDGGKSSDKSSDEKSITTDEGGSGGSNSGGIGSNSGGIGGQPKRAYSDIEGQDETSSIGGDDENKRKKRKDSESAKDANKNVAVSRLPIRQEKGKITGPASKTIGLNNKTSTGIDRKSPCASPKPVQKTTDSDAETDDSKNEIFNVQGPKVPPLKIVIPQQNAAGDQEAGSRNGKNTSTRNHPALPYVVASSNSGNESNTDKESSSSRCASPADVAKLPDEKVTKVVAPTGVSSAEERAQQRVLRSSHRTGPAGQTVDRGSNNSSPQLQSSSPSPAPGSSTETTGNPTQAITTAANNGSPSNQTQTSSESETTGNAPSPSASTSTSSNSTPQNTVELHPRKRKIRASKEESKVIPTVNAIVPPTTESENIVMKEEVHPQDQPITNCYQMYLNIRKQIERRQRNLFPVQPKPPQGFKDYLMNRCTYVLAGKTPAEPSINFPTNLSPTMKEMFQSQEKERHKLKMQHVVEKEKLVLAVEQEILRVHGRAARALANQSLPFSVCTILKDEEVYNMITPEQEEKDRNARSRYNGRLFLSWLQDVDDKWEKIKEAMLFRHHNEVESLHAVQKMDWEWKMKELLLCEFKAKPVIDDQHVPIVHVSDDFDLLPA